jgi:hypothetical protein
LLPEARCGGKNNRLMTIDCNMIVRKRTQIAAMRGFSI